MTVGRSLLLALGCAACAGEAGAPPLVFVRGGYVASQGAGQRLGDGRVFVEHAWNPGERVRHGEVEGTAPANAECVPVAQVPLGDLSRLVAMGVEAPDTALSWSPDETRLAVGAYTGEVLVVDGWTGAVLARRRLAETMVKRVAWAPDGLTLYAGEQSPDAALHALDPETLEARWTLRLADEVGSSPAPSGEDVYGVYSLPAVFGLEVLPGGDLLVSAAHGWTDAGGARRNRSRLLRVDPTGRTVAAWPSSAADAIFVTPKVDLEGGLVIQPMNRSADGPPPPGLPTGGVQVLSIDDLSPVTSVTVDPLPPWFTTAFLWEAVDALTVGARTTLLLGLGDGRVLLEALDGTRLTLEPGAPIAVGEVPIAASVGHGLLRQDEAIFLTSGTNIPYGAAAPDLRPPSAHPGENALWVHGLDGTLRWTWRGPHRLQGLSLGADGRTLVVGAGERSADQRRDLYGALVFDLGPEGSADARSGEERLLAFCATEGPVFFRHAAASDGRIAVAEVPALAPDGTVHGGYRVTVFR